jgi:hypothetical protein
MNASDADHITTILAVQAFAYDHPQLIAFWNELLNGFPFQPPAILERRLQGDFPILRLCEDSSVRLCS